MRNFGRKRLVRPVVSYFLMVRWAIARLFIASAVLLWALPAMAHHALGGRTPTNSFEGFVSGLAHPVIGIDHFLFVIAIGLLALCHPRGMFLPVGFVIGTLLGTGGHILGLNLPAPEALIAVSLLGLGGLLASGRHWSLRGLLLGGAIAGWVHGYAYGESIIGAEMTPLVAYLLGFATIQLGVALGVYGLGRRWVGPSATNLPLALRFAGCTVLGAGAAFLSTTLLG